MFIRFFALLSLFSWAMLAQAQTTQTSPTPSLGFPLNRFEPAIVQFEKQDAEQGKPSNGIVFLGSSSFAYWQTMTTDLAPLPVTNRGFGGSTMAEANYYADRILFPYQPKIIVVYEGENDLNVGENHQTPEQVLAAFRVLVDRVARRLPKAQLYFVSMKPSASRWANWAVTQRGNELIEAYIKTKKQLHFIDVRPVMLGANGRPRPDIFRADSLHMNAKGYALWTGIIKPVLMRAMQTANR